MFTTGHKVSIKNVYSGKILAEAIEIIARQIRASVFLETTAARVESEADERGILVYVQLRRVGELTSAIFEEAEIFAEELISLFFSDGGLQTVAIVQLVTVVSISYFG